MNDGPDIAAVAALIGDPTRARLLTALLADRALSATELAAIAGVSKPTISAHLDKLLRAALVAVDPQGRHRYFRLAGADVARLLETLMGVAWRTGSVRLRGTPTDPALRRARICYDHLAGELGVRIFENLISIGALDARAAGDEPALTATGESLFTRLGVDFEALRRGRRPLCRACLDWSERRHHLAGALGAALLARILEQRWARRARDSRALHFSALGEQALLRAFARRSAA